MAQIHKSHKGELSLQVQRKTPQDLIDAIPDYIHSDMPLQHADFFAGLSYLPLGTLDAQGRPWVSLVVTTATDDPSLGIKVMGNNRTDVIAQTTPADPFARSLTQGPATAEQAQLFAGVGIDFSNRRRNKIAGTINAASVDETGKLHLQLQSDQHVGNCPKYITLRTLAPTQRRAEVVYDSPETSTSALPADAKTVIDRASTVFLATKHIVETDPTGNQTDMGVNHRGGAPGFTRLYEENEGDHVTTYLVMPDLSGNRFYQSLGNIETDPQVGLVFPDFTTGDLLYVTGVAENLLDQDAETLMPRVTLLTRIKVTGAVFVKQALNLELTSEEQFSPYNPPVRYLRQEMDQMGHAAVPHDSATPITATLASTQALSETIKTFNFKLSSPINAPLPGGFGIFDFSDFLDVGYNHMNEANPQLVNEDYVRTWTLSSAPRFDATQNAFTATDEVSVTVKRKPRGLISNTLHDNADEFIAQKLPIAFKGTGAGFTCFTTPETGTPPHVPSHMLWIAGGVGITPFMTMWDGILEMAQAAPNHISTDIVLLFAGRDDDINVLNHFASRHASLGKQVNLNIIALQSLSTPPSTALSARENLRQNFADTTLTLEPRRMQVNDLQSVANLHAREVFMCGPDALMDWSETLLDTLNVDETRRHRETFSF